MQLITPTCFDLFDLPNTRWQCLITQSADSMKTKLPNIIPLPQTE